MSPTSQVTKGQSESARPGIVARMRRRRSLQNAFLVAASLVAAGASSGCTTVHNGYKAITSNGAWNDTVVVLRNRSFSSKAWHRRKHHFCNERHLRDFNAGFRAGYEAMASGSDGCTPSFPPKDYWSWEYQSAEGQNRTSAWFSGYPHGVRAAEEDGVNNWSQLQMSTGLQAEYQQTGMFDHEGALYPIPDSRANQGVPVGDGYVVPSDLPPGTEIVPYVPGPSTPMPYQP